LKPDLDSLRRSPAFLNEGAALPEETAVRLPSEEGSLDGVAA